MAYRKSRGTRGQKCTRFKRVRVRGGGIQKRCAKYAPKRSGGARKARRSRRTGRGRRKPAGMAKRGSKCLSFRRVRVRRGGMQRRCIRYGR